MVQGTEKPTRNSQLVTRNSHWEKAMIQGNKNPVSQKETGGFCFLKSINLQ